MDPINSPQHKQHAGGLLLAMRDRKRFYKPDPAPRMRRASAELMLDPTAVKDWRFVDEPDPTDRLGWKSLRTEHKVLMTLFLGSLLYTGAMLGSLAIAIARAEGWLP